MACPADRPADPDVLCDLELGAIPADAMPYPADAIQDQADAPCHVASALIGGGHEAAPASPRASPTGLDPIEWPSLGEMSAACALESSLPRSTGAAAGAPAASAATGAPEPFYNFAVDFAALHGEAVARAAMVRSDEEARAHAERVAMGARIREEQSHLLARILEIVPHAVREAAARGQRSTSILNFAGSDKFGEFCYLYMLRGAHTGDARREMEAMGVKPALPRLKRMLKPFVVRHEWSRATNDNSVLLFW